MDFECCLWLFVISRMPNITNITLKNPIKTYCSFIHINLKNAPVTNIKLAIWKISTVIFTPSSLLPNLVYILGVCLIELIISHVIIGMVIIAKSIKLYFSNEDNMYIIKKLSELGVNMNYINTSSLEEKEEFKGKTFVLTGTLINITRDKASQIIENLGGRVSSSVSSKTSCVIVGDNPGSKYDKARQLNIPVWEEEEFLQKIEN